MDITTKKGRRGRKDIDRIIVEKGRRGDFSPLQPDHYHSFYEIFYLWSGSCRFLLKGLPVGGRRSGLHCSGGTASLSVFRRRDLRDRDDLFQRRISAFIGPVCRQPHFHIRAGAAAAFLHGQRSYGIPGISALSANPDAH